jgi:hypothetical protein
LSPVMTLSMTFGWSTCFGLISCLVMAETAKKHHSHIRRPLVASDPGQVWLPTGPKVFPEASIAGHGLPMAMTPIEGFGGSDSTTQCELKLAA